MSDGPDICDALQDRYEGGFPGLPAPFGLDLCAAFLWVFSGVLGLGMLASVAVAMTDNNDGGNNNQREREQFEQEFDFENYNPFQFLTPEAGR